MRQLFPSSWPQEELSLQPGTASAGKTDVWGDAYPDTSPAGPSLLEVYAEFLADPTLSPPPYDPDMMINDRLNSAVQGNHAGNLVALVHKWSLSDDELFDGPGGWERKLEEIAVLVTLIACASQKTGQSPKVDFFLVRAVPSSPRYPFLSPPIQYAVTVAASDPRVPLP